LSLDYGMRFSIIPQTYSDGATLGLFDRTLYDATKTGQLLFPKCTVALPASGACPVTSTVAVNPITGDTYSGGLVGLFDPKSYAADSTPYSGIRTFPNGRLFDTQPVQLGPRFGFAYDVFGNGKLAIRGAFGIFYQRCCDVDDIASSGSGVGPMKWPPLFQAPAYYNTTFARLATAQAFLGPLSFYGGSTKMLNPNTYNWNLNVQRDLGLGFMMEVAYVGNAFRHGMGQSWNQNPIPVGTTWSPTGGTCNAVGNCTGTLNPAYINPANTAQPLHINLIRSKIGFNGAQDLLTYTSSGTSNYHSLQVQVNRRFGRNFTLGSNWTWQKTTVYSQNQYRPFSAQKEVRNRKQAANINFTYEIPNVARIFGRNALTDGVLGGWRLDTVMTILSGNPMTVTCSNPSNAPGGYPNGQAGVSGALPFHCAMLGEVFLPEGSTPSASGYPATVAPRLWYPINLKSFRLPGLDTYGYGNTPPQLFWGPSFFNMDLSAVKSFRLFKEGYELQLRADATNVLNRFNPGDPNTTLQYNFATGAQSNANFGTITSGQGGARSMRVELRFRF